MLDRIDGRRWSVAAREAARWTCATSHLLLNAEETGLVGLLAKAAVTSLTYLFVWTAIAPRCVLLYAWLVSARQYLLAFTTSSALLVVAGLLLALYQYMWEWQSMFCRNVRYISLAPSTPEPDEADVNRQENERQPQPQRTTPDRVVRIDEDWDNRSWIEWAVQIARYLLALCLWSGFCWVNAFLMFWVIGQYQQAHSQHNIELLVLHYLEALPLLVGAALFLFYMHPKLFAGSTSGTDEINGVTSDMRQSLI